MKPRRSSSRRSLDSRASRKRRDQEESAFTSILRTLVTRVPGVRTAALVDSEGETVDYAGRGDPFAVRVSAAHWRIVLQLAGAQNSLEGLRWLAVRGARRSHVVYALPNGYALVVAFTRAPGLARWQRALATCALALGQEAGWAPPPAAVAQENTGLAGLAVPKTRPNRHRASRPAWFRIEIIADERRRPCSVRVGGRTHALEILGTVVRRGEGTNARGARPTEHENWAPGEHAWRVRLEKGIEATIVRRRGGAWYADEPVDLLVEPE